jgi:ABC-type transport system involved in multi-copper enzyme maturation permease subunit
MTSSFVEYLRGVRALRTVAILLGLLLAGALIVRLSWGKPPSSDDYINSLERSPTAHVTRTRLPNGRSRTVIDDPNRGVNVVVERDGRTITRIASVSAGGSHERARTDVVRGATVSPRPRDVTAETTMTTTAVTYSPFDIGSLFMMAIPMGLLAATLLGGPLSKENDGHLELAWTKPVSRTRYALSAIVVDLATIAVAEAATAVVVLGATFFWEVPKISFDALGPRHVAFALLAPAAWYACLTAFSASVKRGPGAVLGIGWVAAVVCPVIASTTHGSPTGAGRTISAIFDTISYADPIAYLWFRINGSDADPAHTLTTGLLALGTLAVVYLALAVVQWRRLEA